MNKEEVGKVRERGGGRGREGMGKGENKKSSNLGKWELRRRKGGAKAQ
jgi:hypothetical protein